MIMIDERKEFSFTPIILALAIALLIIGVYADGRSICKLRDRVSALETVDRKPRTENVFIPRPSPTPDFSIPTPDATGPGDDPWLEFDDTEIQ